MSCTSSPHPSKQGATSARKVVRERVREPIERWRREGVREGGWVSVVGEGVGEGEGDWEESREELGDEEVQNHVFLLLPCPFPGGGHLVST